MKPSPRLLAALAIGAVGIGAFQLPFLLESDNGDIPPVIWATLTIFVGWGFVGAGLAAWSGTPENRTGKLMVFTGYLWFVGSLQGFEDPWVYSIASVFGATFLGAAIHLLLAFPSGRLATLRERRLVIGTYFLTTVMLLPGALFSKPEDYSCTDCPENKLLILHEPTVASVSVAVVALLAIYVLGYTARVLIRRWRQAEPQWRAARPVAAAGLVLTGSLILSLLGQLAGFEGAAIEAATVIGLAAFGLIPVHRARGAGAHPAGARRRAQRAARAPGGDAQPGRPARRPGQRAGGPAADAGLPAAGLGPVRGRRGRPREASRTREQTWR